MYNKQTNKYPCCVTLYFDPSRNLYAGNILKNSKVYCLISVCSCFVTVLKFYFFSTNSNGEEEKRGCGVAGGCFTDAVRHSSDNYHHERAY